MAIQTDVVEITYDTETGDITRVRVNRKVTPSTAMGNQRAETIEKMDWTIVHKDDSSFGDGQNWMIVEDKTQNWDIMLCSTHY